MPTQKPADLREVVTSADGSVLLIWQGGHATFVHLSSTRFVDVRIPTSYDARKLLAFFSNEDQQTLPFVPSDAAVHQVELLGEDGKPKGTPFTERDFTERDPVASPEHRVDTASLKAEAASLEDQITAFDGGDRHINSIRNMLDIPAGPIRSSRMRVDRATSYIMRLRQTLDALTPSPTSDGTSPAPTPSSTSTYSSMGLEELRAAVTAATGEAPAFDLSRAQLINVLDEIPF